jgi:hypothetical protein
MSSADLPVEPKSDENDPPAANRPSEETSGNPPDRPMDPRDSAGRTANDPSLSHTDGVHEAFQAAPGKPDGEVDTRG